MNSFFITGTDTDVGKTFVSSLLFNYLEDPCYFKPVETGYGEDSFIPDKAMVMKESKFKDENRFKTLYKLKLPLSPHLSSIKSNTSIDIKSIVKEYKDIENNFKSIIVEGAGGVLAPLNTSGDFIYTLIKELSIPTILVTSTRVGTINHTLLSYEFLKSKDIKISGIVFNYFSSLPHEIDNINFIVSYTKIKNKLLVPLNLKDIDKDSIKNFINNI